MLSITSHEYLQKAEVLVDSWILMILKTVFVELLWLYCSSFCARLVNFSEIQVISIITDLKKSEMWNMLKANILHHHLSFGHIMQQAS